MGKRTPPRFFITDDDPDDRDLISEALAAVRGDAVVKGFLDGKQLLEYLGSGADDMPDLIVLDMNMPVKNGLDTLRELKASAVFEKIPVVMLTTSSRPSDVAACNSLGVSTFFHKPARLEEYIALAGTILSFAV